MGDGSVTNQPAAPPLIFDLTTMTEGQMKAVAQQQARATGQSYEDVLTKIETAKASGQTTITFSTITAPPHAPRLIAPNPDNPGQPLPSGVWTASQLAAALMSYICMPIFQSIVHMQAENLIKQTQMIRQLSGNQMYAQILANIEMATDIAQAIRDSAQAQANQYMMDAYMSLAQAGVGLAQAAAIVGTPFSRGVKEQVNDAWVDEHPDFDSQTEKLKTRQQAIEDRLAGKAPTVSDDPELANANADLADMDEEALLKEKSQLDKRIENREKMRSDWVHAETTKRNELISVVANIGNKVVDAAKNMLDAMYTNDKGAIDAAKAQLEAAKATLDQLISANIQLFNDCGSTLQGILQFEETGSKGMGQYAA